MLGSLAGLAICLQATPAAGASGLFGTVSVDTSPSLGEFETMADGGVRTLRVIVNWQSIEPDDDPLLVDWDELDAAVEGSARSGVELLPTFMGQQGRGTTPPKGAAEHRDWARFLEAVARRYGPAGLFWTMNPTLPRNPIRTWQIWNEQNSPTFWRPRPKPRKYGKLVKLSAATLRGVDPGAKIVLGGMFGTPFGGQDRDWYSWVFLRRLMRVPGIRSSFDAYSLHPYARSLRGVKFQVRKGRKAMKAARARRTPLWITETGWSTISRRADPSVPVPARGEAGQARKLRKAFKLWERKERRWRLQRVLWFSWRDGVHKGGCVGWCDAMGLFRPDLTPKRAWGTYKRFATTD